MPPTKIILLGCGSFNPPTYMHLRLFEIARDYLHRLGNYVVIGGLMSPVHDGYAKKELIPSTHRLAMVKLAIESNEWIKLSDWESKQESWSRTKTVIQYHQNLVNSILNNSNNEDVDSELVKWLSNNIKNGIIGNIQVKLLCGSDMLESFGTPGLWADEDIDAIVGNHGLLVVTREGCFPHRFIYESDLLTKYKNNIHIVTEWITNEVSSTKIRRALRRCESVKYLLPDVVIDYILSYGLYGSQTKETKYLDLITSPIDIIMESPSPSSNNCINICNNNLFSNADNQKKVLNVTNEDTINKINKSFRHPGQAIKIITDSSGRTILTNQVSRTLSLDTCDNVKHNNVLKTKSLIEYIFVERKTHAKSEFEIFV